MFGSSVARANAANVSISKLIHNIWTVLSGCSVGGNVIEVTIMIMMAPKLMTS